MFKASIDIGSNSILLLVADVEGDKIKNVVVNEQRVTGLGKNIDMDKKFTIEAMDDSYNALEEYRDILLNLEVDIDSVTVTATEAARVVSNSISFFDKIMKDFGFKVQIITGSEEAFFTAKGVVSGEDKLDKFVIIDIGGASTEFILLTRDPFKIFESVSLPFGVVRASMWLEQGSFDENLAKILKSYDLDYLKQQYFVGVAGTFTSIMAMVMGANEYSDDLVHCETLTKDSLLKIFNITKGLTSSEILNRFSFLGKRATVINSGIKIVLLIMQHLEIQEFKISTFGLRFGTLMSANRH